MKCPNCNSEVFEQTKFCGKCGTKIDHPESDNETEKKESIVEVKEPTQEMLKIIAKINKTIWHNYSQYKDLEPIYERYSFNNKVFHRLIYSIIIKDFTNQLCVNFDDKGNITAENLTKNEKIEI